MAAIKVHHTVFLLGILLYVMSFFLTAVTLYGPDGQGEYKPEPSYDSPSGAICAIMSLSAWGDLYHNGIRWPGLNLRFVAVLISSLINPILIISVILLLRNPNGKAGSILRIVLLCMLPLPLVYFYSGGDIRPSTGYFLWTTAILMLLFSDRLGRLNAQAGPSESGKRS